MVFSVFVEVSTCYCCQGGAAVRLRLLRWCDASSSSGKSEFLDQAIPFVVDKEVEDAVIQKTYIGCTEIFSLASHHDKYVEASTAIASATSSAAILLGSVREAKKDLPMTSVVHQVNPAGSLLNPSICYSGNEHHE